jgi:hypothetical protein
MRMNEKACITRTVVLGFGSVIAPALAGTLLAARTAIRQPRRK